MHLVLLVKCHKLQQFDFFECTFSFNSFHSTIPWIPIDCNSPLNLTPALCGSASASQLSPHPLTTRARHQIVFGLPLPSTRPSRSWLSPRGFQDVQRRITTRYHRGSSSSVVAGVWRETTVRVTGVPSSSSCCSASHACPLLSHTDHPQLFAL